MGFSGAKTAEGIEEAVVILERIGPARVQEADPVPQVVGAWDRGLTECQRALEAECGTSAQGLGRWPQASLLRSQLVPIQAASVSSETTGCVSLFTGLSLEQESMQLGHRAGRTGRTGAC